MDGHPVLHTPKYDIEGQQGTWHHQAPKQDHCALSLAQKNGPPPLRKNGPPPAFFHRAHVVSYRIRRPEGGTAWWLQGWRWSVVPSSPNGSLMDHLYVHCGCIFLCRDCAVCAGQSGRSRTSVKQGRTMVVSVNPNSESSHIKRIASAPPGVGGRSLGIPIKQ
jgi:hypothetical protein